MKTSQLIILPVAGFLFCTIPACKNDKKEECATIEWKVRDSLLTVREHEVAQRERALALNSASENLAIESSNATTQMMSNSTTGTGGKKMNIITNNRPKATEKFYAKDAGNYPESSSRLLTEKDVQFLSHWGHTIMLNEIYARHGMDFNDDKLKAHFNAQKWYRNGRRNVDKSLTSIEKANIAFLKTHTR